MDSKTIQTYNLMAKEYDEETVDFWNKIPRDIFDKFAASVSGPVLDVGSGPGRDGLLLKERGLDVTCIDASSEMVKICLERGLKALEADFMNLPFDDNSFGGVWAYTSLLHVSKAQIVDALDEVKRILKTGGLFGLGMIEGEYDGYRESSEMKMPRWFSFYKKEEVESLLEAAGFKIIYFRQFRLEGKTKDYLNFLAVKG